MLVFGIRISELVVRDGVEAAARPEAYTPDWFKEDEARIVLRKWLLRLVMNEGMPDGRAGPVDVEVPGPPAPQTAPQPHSPRRR